MSDQPGYPPPPHQPQQPWPAQPPAPQAWQQPAGQPYPPQQQGWPQQQAWAPPPPKKAFSPRKKALFVLIALVVMGGGVVAMSLISKATMGPEKQAQSLEIGDCVQLTGEGKAADAVKTPCQTANTPYTVSVKALDKGDWNCKEGFYRVAIDRGSRGDGVALCLAINGQLGACFDDIDSSTPPPLQPCASARLKVSEVFSTASFVNSPCAEGTEKVISYTSYLDPRFKSATICFSRP